MDIPFTVKKYLKQLKAMSPNYDTLCSVGASDPIAFEDSENVRLAFAAIADTHLPNSDVAEKNLENIFTDIFNSAEKTDAVLLAGDIADYGFRGEYERFFRVFGKYRDRIKLLVTMGNHDVRLFYKTASAAFARGAEALLGISLNGKPYYSYEVNGYRFIVLCTEKPFLLRAHISPAQLDFLDGELKKGTEDSKPCFVMCHQSLDYTHGHPNACQDGGMGKQSDRVRAIMEKYKNVFFLNGHLHSGVCDYVEEVLSEENNVVSINLPSYRKENNFGLTDAGIGYLCEVYGDRIVFRARSFLKGEYITGSNTYFEYPLILSTDEK